MFLGRLEKDDAHESDQLDESGNIIIPKYKFVGFFDDEKKHYFYGKIQNYLFASVIFIEAMALVHCQLYQSFSEKKLNQICKNFKVGIFYKEKFEEERLNGSKI